MKRALLRDLPVGTQFRYVDKSREGDGSGFDDIQTGKVIAQIPDEKFTAVKTWGKHRQRYMPQGEIGPLLDWPGDRFGLWHHLTTVELADG